LSQDGFKVEFSRGRFALRFFLLSFVVTLIALTFYYGGNPEANYSHAHLVSIIGLVLLFATIALSLLYLARTAIADMTFNKGFLVCWAIIFLTATCLVLIIIFRSPSPDSLGVRTIHQSGFPDSAPFPFQLFKQCCRTNYPASRTGRNGTI